MRLSVLIPAVNETDSIGPVLQRTAAALPGHEIIVVAAGDGVAAAATAASPPATIVRSDAPRGASLNTAARNATGDALLFLHADTLLPLNAEAAITGALADRTTVGGAFRLRFDQDATIARAIEQWVHARSVLLNVFLGDQGLFVRKDVFFRAGGFRDWNVMEDLEILDRLRGFGRLRQVDASVVTSARRHVLGGWLRTTGSVWLVTWLYFFGVPTSVLTAVYRRGRR